MVDNSPDPANELIAREFGACYLPEPRPGKAYAFNTAVGAAKGEYIALLDDDDEWLPDKIATERSFLQDTPSLDALTCGNLVRNSFGHVRPRQNFTGDASAVSVRDLLTRRVKASAAFTVRRRVLLAIGGLDPRYRFYEDLDLFLRLILAGYAFTFLGIPLYLACSDVPFSVTRTARTASEAYECQRQILEAAAADPRAEALMAKDEWRHFMGIWRYERVVSPDYLKEAGIAATCREAASAADLCPLRQRLAMYSMILPMLAARQAQQHLHRIASGFLKRRL